MKSMKIKVTFTEGLLGTSPADPEIYENYIGDKSPDAPTLAQEVAAIGVTEVVEKGMTIFHKLEDGTPFLYDYHLKGFFKDTCGMLSRLSTSESSKLKAYKKIIDGLIFVYPRQIPLQLNGDITVLQRPLRAGTPQGERNALAISEEAAVGTSFECEIEMLDPKHEKLVREWLEHGKRRGLGQWRGSGRGRFVWEEVT